jgi:hypothetical protein
MYAATTKDDGNAADGRFSAACRGQKSAQQHLARISGMIFGGIKRSLP